MENLKLFLRSYVLSIDINQRHSCDYMLKNYINLNVVLQACGHDKSELTRAISDCNEAINKLHQTAVEARQQFDHVGLQGTVRETLDDAEKDKLT